MRIYAAIMGATAPCLQKPPQRQAAFFRHPLIDARVLFCKKYPRRFWSTTISLSTPKPLRCPHPFCAYAAVRTGGSGGSFAPLIHASAVFAVRKSTACFTAERSKKPQRGGSPPLYYFSILQYAVHHDYSKQCEPVF